MSEMELLAREEAAKHGLDPALICALCEVESSWIPWAARHEAGYRWLYEFDPEKGGTDKYTITDLRQNRWRPAIHIGTNPAGSTMPTELIMQQTSWGLLQIMGATARERGFRSWLTELCDPQVNLEWGCRHLRWMVDHNNAYGLPDYRVKPEDLAAAWNTGSVRRGDDGELINVDYVRRAAKAMEGYQ